MKNVLRWFLSPVVMGTLALLILSALVWWAFPLIAFGSARPFEGFWARVITLAVLWGLWIGWLVLGLVRRRRTHAALVKGLSARSGMMSSFCSHLPTSARSCMDPNGPASMGPRRLCMKLTILNRNRYTNVPAGNSTATSTPTTRRIDCCQ